MNHDFTYKGINVDVIYFCYHWKTENKHSNYITLSYVEKC